MTAFRERESVPHAVPPRRVGEYELVASLGRGGAGEAFLALVSGRGGFRKLVVLKLLHPELEESLEVVDQFLDEARLAARLNHPNIVPTLEVGHHERQHYIAMAFLEGLPLGRALAMLNERGERVPPPIAASIAAELLDALAYAHDLRDFDGSPLEIVHRDVSPPNVFVCWDGSVKLLDFGIARAASRRASTDSGLIKGKFGYIAPEQASGEGTDRRADLWSVGVVLWEMLTGHRLFPARNDVGTLHALVAGVITPVTQHAPDTPAPLVALLERTLQRDPDDRFHSASEMRDALRAWLDSLPNEITRDDLAAWLGDSFVGERERQQALLRECVGGARLGASSTGSFHVAASRSPSSESRRISTVPPPPEPKSPRPPFGPLAFALLAVLALVGIVWSSGVKAPVGEARVGEASVGEARVGEASVGEAPVGEASVEEAPVGHARAGSEAEPPRADPEASASPRADGASSEALAPGAVAAPSSEPRSPREAPVGAPTSARVEAPSSAAQPGARAPSAPRDAPEAEVPTGSAEDTEERSDEAATPAVGVGWLSLDTTPWASVTLDGEPLGHTPLMRVALPEGEHELLLENPERGLRRVYVVRVRAGETTRRRIAF